MEITTATINQMKPIAQHRPAVHPSFNAEMAVVSRRIGDVISTTIVSMAATKLVATIILVHRINFVATTAAAFRPAGDVISKTIVATVPMKIIAPRRRSPVAIPRPPLADLENFLANRITTVFQLPGNVMEKATVLMARTSTIAVTIPASHGSSSALTSDAS